MRTNYLDAVYLSNALIQRSTSRTWQVYNYEINIGNEFLHANMSTLLMLLGLACIALLVSILAARYYLNGGFYRRYCDQITTTLHGKTAVITGMSCILKSR